MTGAAAGRLRPRLRIGPSTVILEDRSRATMLDDLQALGVTVVEIGKGNYAADTL